MDKKIKFYKVVFGLSIASILISGLIKLIWGVDWFDLEVNKRLSEFFLFKNIIVQHIVMQISLMFNYVLIIAIVNKALLKDVFKKLWWLLILTYGINYLGRQAFFFLTPITGILLNIIYCYRIDKNTFKKILKGVCLVILATILLTIYQASTLLIRFNYIPPLDTVFSFYVQLIVLLDMYIFGYFTYKYICGR